MSDVLASIIIPTLDREATLADCLRSLNAQTETRFEIILLRDRGPLAALRNEGLRRATAPVVCFLDDDVVCPPTWLACLLRVFDQSPRTLGVSGPAIISESNQLQRDLFRYRYIKLYYDGIFIQHMVPGRLNASGAPTILPYDTGYEGPCDFLEACNMSFRTQAFKEIGGFDEAYGGIGDWSEPDAALRLRQRFPDGQLWYTSSAALEHRPSRTGAYLLRKHTGARLTNYHLFRRRWVRPSLRSLLYTGFLHGYFKCKELSALCVR